MTPWIKEHSSTPEQLRDTLATKGPWVAALALAMVLIGMFAR